MFTTDQHLSQLVSTIHRRPVSTLTPKEFFFLRDGVPILVYEGFPQGMLRLQQELGELPGIHPP